MKITNIIEIHLEKPKYEIEMRSIVATYDSLSDEGKRNVNYCIAAKSYHVSGLIPSSLIEGNFSFKAIIRNVTRNSKVQSENCYKISDVFQHYFPNIRMDYMLNN